jgi:phage I-like protein
MGEEGHPHALPGERVVRARDGRQLAISDFATIIANTQGSLPLPFDWDHKSLLGAWSEDGTRAAGWIDRLEAVEEPDEDRPRPGLWGHVETWTPKGRDDVELRYYRGLSPAVRFERRYPRKDGDPPPPPLVLGLINVALTNLPALEMHLLHSQEPAAQPPKEIEMSAHLRALARKLGLPDDADEAAVEAALDAQNREREALAQQLVQQRAQTFAEKVQRTLNDAIASKKLLPAERELFASTLVDDAAVERFNAFMATRPEPGIFSTPPAPPAPPANAPKGSAEVPAGDPVIFRQMGVTAEQLSEVAAERARIRASNAGGWED